MKTHTMQCNAMLQNTKDLPTYIEQPNRKRKVNGVGPLDHLFRPMFTEMKITFSPKAKVKCSRVSIAPDVI